MAALPRLSDEPPVIAERRRMGLVCDAPIHPEDRHLTYFHLLAICCDRRVLAELVMERMGGRFLVPPELVDAELARRQDVDAVELLNLNAPRRQALHEYEENRPGPRAAWVRF